MNNTLTLVPAYGRDYKSKAVLLADWLAGKDFRIVGIFAGNGTYTSIRDTEILLNTDYTNIQFRYKKLQSTFIHPLFITEMLTHV